MIAGLHHLVAIAESTPQRNALRRVFGYVVGLCIVTGALGCDKQRHTASAAVANTSLEGKPRVLSLVFGDFADPRLLPIARLANGVIEPLSLSPAAWKAFDRTYFATSAAFAVYTGGHRVGDAVVSRGMWDGEFPLYSLPKCQSPRPLAAVTLHQPPSGSIMVEMLAVSDSLPTPGARAPIIAADRDSARAFLLRAGQRAGLTAAARSELDAVSSAIPTGATSHPTLVGSFMEQSSALDGRGRHVLAIADWSDSTSSYHPSFVHVPTESNQEFRRLLDHADLTGDDVDEIVLESWHSGSDSFLVILQYRGGEWREVARSTTSWCNDPPQ